MASSAALALCVAAALTATVTVDSGPARAGTPVPGAAGCPMFPSDNVCPVSGGLPTAWYPLRVPSPPRRPAHGPEPSEIIRPLSGMA